MCSYIDKENQISRLLPHDSLYVQCSGFRYPNRRGMIELKTELWQQQQPRHEKWQENPNTNSTNVWNTLSLQKLPSKCLSLFSIFWQFGILFFFSRFFYFQLTEPSRKANSSEKDEVDISISVCLMVCAVGFCCQGSVVQRKSSIFHKCEIFTGTLFYTEFITFFLSAKALNSKLNMYAHEMQEDCTFFSQ